MFHVKCVIQGASNKNVSLGNLLQRSMGGHCLKVEPHCNALSESLGLNRSPLLVEEAEYRAQWTGFHSAQVASIQDCGPGGLEPVRGGKSLT